MFGTIKQIEGAKMDTLYTNEKCMDNFNDSAAFFQLRIGMWIDGEFSWIEMSEKEYHIQNCVQYKSFAFQDEHKSCLIDGHRISLENLNNRSKEIKLYVQYEQTKPLAKLAYYRPKDHLLSYHIEEGLVFINGKIDEKGIKQYTVTSADQINEERHLWGNIRKGALKHQPLASRNIVSAFTLESFLLPYEHTSADIWKINAINEEKGVSANRKLIKNRLEFSFER